MSVVYITADGDTVDLIAYNQYGTTEGGVVEKLLVANPSIADYGPILPYGVKVNLPVIAQQQSATKGVKLWD